MASTKSTVMLEQAASLSGTPSPELRSQLERIGGPFPSFHASLGGLPTRTVDVPICAVFLLLFVLGAVGNMYFLQTNLRRGHKFLISGVLFGFCMARIMAQVMRIVWACHPLNLRVGIASQIFVAAGVVLLFIINLIFAQRIVRATHPHIGWNRVTGAFFYSLYALVVLSLLMLITCTVQSFYTLNTRTLHLDRAVQLYGQTAFAALAFLPIPIVLLAVLLPAGRLPAESFGKGRLREKVCILLASSTLLTLGAAFRAGTNYSAGRRPRTFPAAYQDKACFFIFNFVIEILVVYGYILTRVDLRFHIPNGAQGPGDYSRNEAKS